MITLVICECCHNLEHHSSSVIDDCHICSTGVTYSRHLRLLIWYSTGYRCFYWCKFKIGPCTIFFTTINNNFYQNRKFPSFRRISGFVRLARFFSIYQRGSLLLNEARWDWLKLDLSVSFNSNPVSTKMMPKKYD